jgi:hypothetical protein
VALTSAQQEEVETALFAEDTQQRLRVVAGMTAEQLHAFARGYNWDDGFAAPRAVLASPRCERGTALLIYWAAGGPFDEKTARGHHRNFLTEARERLLGGEFQEEVVAYDPIADNQINKVQLLKLRRAGVPEALIRPALGH